MAPTFDDLLQQRLARRTLLAGSAALGLAAVALPAAARPSATAGTAGRPASPPLPDLPPSTADALLLARGFRHDLIAAWGDPLFAGAPAFDARALAAGANLREGAAAAQERQFGTNNDAIAYFPIDGRSSRHGLLCVNHEYVQVELSFAGLPLSSAERERMRADWTRAHPQAVRFMQAAHGVSVLEVSRRMGRGWQRDPRSRFTRRITSLTPMEIRGPARGHELLRTRDDPQGVRVLGTFANCAGGRTPWGTYLTAEENIDDYFGGYRSWSAGTEDFRTLSAHARFPGFENSLYGWEHADPRFDYRNDPREPLRHGWIVEIDPRDPGAAPRKRTALGRFSHEGANTIVAQDGRVVAYMGDDDKFEYVYKFVTRGRFDPRRPEANRDLLDEGTLYVARFDADGTGQWLPLVHDPDGPLNAAAGFRDQGEVVIKARAAADLLGATPMDRPEDVEPNPLNGRVYMALTKNDDRSAAAGREFVRNREIDLGVDAANPRPRNDFGHVIELVEDGDDATATRFRWNVFLLAGDPRDPQARFVTRLEDLRPGELRRGDVYYAGYAGRDDVSPIACPDNLGFDPFGRLWIITDHDLDGMPNNGCFVVPTEGPERGRLRQLASGPVGCEFCGCEFTPDGRTLFLAVQHPGEGGTVDAPVSHWPDGGGLPARSGVVAVMREDGGPI